MEIDTFRKMGLDARIEYVHSCTVKLELMTEQLHRELLSLRREIMAVHRRITIEVEELAEAKLAGKAKKKRVRRKKGQVGPTDRRRSRVPTRIRCRLPEGYQGRSDAGTG